MNKFKYAIILLVLIFSSFSCRENNEKSELILTFENNLGSEETTYLNKLVFDFEIYLKETYLNDKQKFKRALIDVKNQSFVLNKYIFRCKIDSRIFIPRFACQRYFVLFK